jgi:long-chain acyl-CoA synthetase
LQKVKPTIFLSVPRIWEKLSDEINKRKMNSIIPECITHFFKKKTLEYNNYIGKINNISFFIVICYLISRLIICNSIKRNIGLNNCRTYYNTASNISKKTLDYFAEIDIPIYEMYGMTETCGVISVNYKNNYKKYSVGKPFYGEVKLGWDNEIIYRGANIFKKYKYNYIDTEKTLKDGWLYTGDIGEFDDDGYLYITGRKKDLIKTSGGENISPLKIETEIKEYAPNIDQIIIIGEGRNFLSALIFMKNYNQEYIKKAIDKYNKNAISKAQQIKKYIIINDDLTIDNGLLTQTMKMKRNMIEKRYQKIIDDIY